ncbi:MAG: tyrosine-type recombinase/integrase [Actinomycetota bacterium]|nr:tyrosine-type recombinase/integrase [Actinomycetota bacterium]
MRWACAASGPSQARRRSAHQNTVGYRWRTTLSSTGVEGVRLHDLRHFFASGLIASGCDVVGVQRALGHAKSTTTLTRYAHLGPTVDDGVCDAAARSRRLTCGFTR